MKTPFTFLNIKYFITMSYGNQKNLQVTSESPFIEKIGINFYKTL